MTFYVKLWLSTIDLLLCNALFLSALSQGNQIRPLLLPLLFNNYSSDNACTSNLGIITPLELIEIICKISLIFLNSLFCLSIFLLDYVE